MSGSIMVLSYLYVPSGIRNTEVEPCSYEASALLPSHHVEVIKIWCNLGPWVEIQKCSPIFLKFYQLKLKRAGLKCRKNDESEGRIRKKFLNVWEPQIRAWWKAQPAVDPKNCSGRCQSRRPPSCTYLRSMLTKKKKCRFIFKKFVFQNYDFWGTFGITAC